MQNKDVYFNFLEELRRSGETNMFGATPYLEANFEELSHAEAVAILKEWMQNYNELAVRLGWDKADDVVIDGEEEISEPEYEYTKLFDADIDRDIIDNFLKVMADQEVMNELDNAKHIWYLEGLPFIVSYEDGKANLISLVNDKVTVYDKWLREYCDDFGLDFEETRQKILDKTGIDFKDEELPPEDDSEEVYDYGTEAVIEDEFEPEEE